VGTPGKNFSYRRRLDNPWIAKQSELEKTPGRAIFKNQRMTTMIKEILGELSGLSEEKQRIAASVVHALWSEERSENVIHPEWQAELARRNAQLASGEIEAVDEASMESFVGNLVSSEG